MARAIRASTSSALIVHSEKGFDSRKLDEGRMAHPPFGMPSALRAQLWSAQNCSLHAAILHARDAPLPPGPRPRLLAQPGSLLTGSSLEMPRGIPLRSDPHEPTAGSC